MLARSSPAWFPDWSEDVCAIVASGPSVTIEDVAKLQGRCRVVVINNGFTLAPWADVLYAADAKWWDHHPDAQRFAGLKIATDEAVAKRCRLQRVLLLDETDKDTDRIVVGEPGRIARGGNSAFQAVNLVTQFGVRRQLWIGFDFHGEHWHGKHPEPLKNPRPHTLDKWRMRLDQQAPVLAGLGVEVVSASEQSALTAYRKMSVDQALSHWGV